MSLFVPRSRFSVRASTLNAITHAQWLRVTPDPLFPQLLMRSVTRVALRAVATLLSCSLALASCSSNESTKPVDEGSISLTSDISAVTIARSGNATATLTLARTTYSGEIAMTAEGLPTGVTITFTPSAPSKTATTVLAILSVDQSAAPGTSTITLRATGTGVTAKTATIALTVPTPSISLALGANAVTTPQGATVTVPLIVTRINGAAGSIALAAEGLPANITADFAPSPIASSESNSALTFNPAANAAVGTYPIVVRATVNGLPSVTATVQLTITSAGTPSYTLTTTPATVTSIAGQQAVTSVTLTRSNGFAGTVALTLEGAPAGVTGSFSPSSVTGSSSTLTLSTAVNTVAGTYPMTVRGTAGGLTDRTISITLTVFAQPGLGVAVTPGSLTLAQGATGQAAIALNRIGGLTGFVVMSATAPAGIVAEFDPTTIASASSTSSVNISVGSTVAAGTYNVAISAAGVGGVIATTNLTVNVFVVPAFSLAATNASLIQGTSATSTVTITRVGGFTGDVNLSATGVPANVTASFAPIAANGATSTLTFTAAANATPGTYTITVNGTGNGVTARSTTLTLTITPTGGTVSWRFCAASRVPVWFAFRNGQDGSWTRVTPSGDNTFAFTLTGNTGSVVYVANSGAGTQATAYFLTTAELMSVASSECANNPTTKALNGSFAGLASGNSGWAFAGGSSGFALFPSVTFNLPEVENRLADLLAFRTTTETATNITPDAVILRRGVNYAANSEIPVIDFANGVAPATATITLGNFGSEIGRVITGFRTSNGIVGTFPFGPLAAAGSIMQYGVPSSLTQAGDFHFHIGVATSLDSTSVRTITQYYRNLTAHTLTLGGSLSAPTTTVTSIVPFARIKVQGTWQGEYGDAVSTSIVNTVGTNRGWTLVSSRAFTGAASSYELEIPDLFGVVGFNNAWAPPTGIPTTVATTASGTAGVIAEGSSFKSATRVQTIIP